MSEAKFVQSEKPYIAAKYSKKKIGIGIGGNGAMMFITPRFGEDFDEEMLYTVELMRHANVMYEMLKSQSRMMHKMGFTDERDAIELLLSKARGEQ